MTASALDLRAATLTQPWAGLVAAGIKLVENRGKPIMPKTIVGHRIAIHASREIDKPTYARIAELAPELADRALPWFGLSKITGAILATAVVAKIYDGGWDAESIMQCRGELAEGLELCTGRADQVRWFFGPVAYALRDVRLLAEPVPCKGALGLWRCDDHVRALVQERTAA